MFINVVCSATLNKKLAFSQVLVTLLQITHLHSPTRDKCLVLQTITTKSALLYFVCIIAYVVSKLECCIAIDCW